MVRILCQSILADLEHNVSQLVDILVVDLGEHPLDHSESALDNVKVQSVCGDLRRVAAYCTIPLWNALARRCPAHQS